MPRQTPCDNDRCNDSIDTRAGMDHWWDVTEFDTDEVGENQYCSLDCVIADLQERVEQ